MEEKTCLSDKNHVCNVKSHKKEWAIIGFFLVMFCLLVNIITYVLRPNDDIKRRFTGFYYQKSNSIDMIFIGSSSVMPYWASPLAWHEYGFTSWPLSTNTQETKAEKLLLQEALKTQHPKVVIFEARRFAYGVGNFDADPQYDAWVRNVTDNLKYSFNKIKAVNLLVDDISIRYRYYFDIMKYHSQWKKLNQINWGCWDFERFNEYGGHFISPNVANQELDWHDFHKILDTMSIMEEQEIILRDLLDYCKEKNITALFTVNPFVAITEEDQKKYNYIEKIITDEYGYNFINFNNLYDEIGVDFDFDFYNAKHMNVRGAEKFTRYLADYLVKNYELEDKRGGTSYSDEWDAMYESWKANADQAIATIEQKVKEGNYDE